MDLIELQFCFTLLLCHQGPLYESRRTGVCLVRVDRNGNPEWRLQRGLEAHASGYYTTTSEGQLS